MEQPFQSQTEAPAHVELQNGLFPLEHPDGAAETRPTTQEETSSAPITLATLLQYEATHAEREQWMGLAWGGTFVGSLLFLLPFLCQNDGLLKTSMVVCFTLFALVGIVGWGWLYRGFNKREHALLAAVSQINDKQYVGILVRSLWLPSIPVRQIAKDRVLTLLPTLCEGDAVLFSKTERNQLRQYLSDVRYGADLQLAILQGMKQFGDEQELAVIKQLARGFPTFGIPSSVPRELRTAAAACLVALEARLKEQRVGAQLLRPSSVPTSSGADLLRPAACGATTPPEQLLHPSELGHDTAFVREGIHEPHLHSDPS